MMKLVTYKGLAEVRGLISHIPETRSILQNAGAAYKGEYAFTDHIYAIPNVDLNTEFVRIRVYQKTQWAQKNVVVVHKRTLQQGQMGITVFHQECDTFEEAQQILDPSYWFLFSFSRIGWEYSWNHMRIFVEDIQSLEPTVEVIAPAVEQIQDLFQILQIDHRIPQSIPCIMKDRLYENNN